MGLGLSGGVLYLPVMILLPQWFSERRGLAGGIIFAGTGVGGKLPASTSSLPAPPRGLTVAARLTAVL